MHPARPAPAMISRLGHRVPRRRQRGALPALAPSGRNVRRSGHRPRHRIVRPCARFGAEEAPPFVAGVAWPPPHQRRRGDHGLMRSCDSSPEPKMLRGTEGSNPAPSSEESAANQHLSEAVRRRPPIPNSSMLSQHLFVPPNLPGPGYPYSECGEFFRLKANGRFRPHYCACQ